MWAAMSTYNLRGGRPFRPRQAQRRPGGVRASHGSDRPDVLVCESNHLIVARSRALHKAAFLRAARWLCRATGEKERRAGRTDGDRRGWPPAHAPAKAAPGPRLPRAVRASRPPPLRPRARSATCPWLIGIPFRNTSKLPCDFLPGRGAEAKTQRGYAEPSRQCHSGKAPREGGVHVLTPDQAPDRASPRLSRNPCLRQRRSPHRPSGGSLALAKGNGIRLWSSAPNPARVSRWPQFRRRGGFQQSRLTPPPSGE